MSKKQPTALITGASSGIGRAFAAAFAKRGYELILTGRNVNALMELVEELKCPATVIPGDLSDPAEVTALLAALPKTPIHVFINNAGVGAAGPFEELSSETEIRMLHINCEAMHRLFKAVLLRMEEQGFGRILNVASSAGLLPGGPYMASYYASKSYVVSLTRAVAEELREKKSPVRVAVLCPGPVDTDFNRAAGIPRGLPGISPELCVREALREWKRGKTVLVPTLRMRFALAGSWLLPNGILIRITAHQQKKKL